MPRENSFSDEDGRSLTPDLEDIAHSPTYNTFPTVLPPQPSSGHANPGISSKQSVRSAKSHLRARVVSHPQHPNHSPMTPKERFRRAVRKVMAIHRTSSTFATRGMAGAEPGLNPRDPQLDAEYGRMYQQDCVIQVIDYSSVRSSFGRMTNREFVALMDDEAASKPEPWTKVRWINISGFSWDVIKAVSLRYDLHPLALEDIFHTRSRTRSKADYYQRHLFLRILAHELLDQDAGASDVQWAAGSTLVDSEPESFGKNSFEMSSFEKEDDTLDGSASSRLDTLKRRDRRRRPPILPSSTLDTGVPARPHPRRASTTSTVHYQQLQRNLAAGFGPPPTPDDIKLEQLKERDQRDPRDRVKVKLNPVWIFLLRDGTVVSIHPTPSEELTAPIVARLRQRDTVLRSTADPSILVHALIDLVVDKAMVVIDRYHETIRRFEAEVLQKPKMRTVRNLHILSGELILLKRTLDPMKTVVYGLRRYDLDRAAAIIDMSDPANAGQKVEGWMTHKSKIYLADVHDHMEHILTSLDMFTGIADNLVDYTFNLASYEMNEVMRRLTTATIVFLPLTLCTGYFGMNFEFMYSVQGQSEKVFWYTAVIVSCLIVPIFIYPDFIRMAHSIKKMFSREDKKLAKVVRATK
ncbi:magnesium transporter [Flagelloscypha sp. PMI_526]|nr:magnesium transporter [Flagelloscypha sp. PMI_526]